MKTEEQIREQYEWVRNKYCRGDYGISEPIRAELMCLESVLEIPEDESFLVAANVEKFAQQATW